MNTTKKETQKKTNSEMVSTNIRVKIEVKDMLEKEVERLNKLRKGSKKVNSSDLIKIGLSLISPEHHQDIISQTITGADRRKVAFSNYKKKHKKISSEEFLDLIQYREIDLNDYLPEEFKRREAANGLTKV